MKLRHTLEGHAGPVLCARFGPDGRRLVTGGRDKTINIWSLRGAKLERSLDGHRRAVNVLAFTPEGELLSGDGGGQVRVWSWPKGKLIHELDGHDGPIYTLGASPDGRLIASGSRDETVCVWAAESGELAWEQQAGPGTVGAFELDRSGEWVVSRGWRGPVTIWSTSTWGYAAVLPIVEKGLTGACLRPGYEQVVCCFEAGVAIYDADDGRLLDAIEVDCKGLFELDLSVDGRYVAIAANDGHTRIFEIVDEELALASDERDDDEQDAADDDDQ